MKRALNLYAGIGGNRKKWHDIEVVAIEIDPKIAEVYSGFYPNDEIIIGDAKEYLLNNFQKFDFIWASPPCQSHSRMIRSGKNRRPRYVDLSLYEIVLFLKYNYGNYYGEWVVENVKPYYTPLIETTATIDRHVFWSSFEIDDSFIMPNIKDFINKTTTSGANELKRWLGLEYEGNIYYNGNHCPAQVLRNCVHPLLGEHIFEQYLKTIK